MRWMWAVLMGIWIIGSAPAWAQDGRPDARLEFSSFSVGLLLGYSDGEGTLDFQGRQYRFTISGFKVATLGISRVNAEGQVYRLRDIADFAGRYVVAEGGLTFIKGGGPAMLRNEHGVTLYLQNAQVGLDLTLGGGGLSIVLESAPDEEKPAPTGMNDTAS